MGKAVGVGGVFLKAKDPKGLQKWYHEHLGVPLSEHGYTSFEGPEAQGTTVFSFFPVDTKYFGEGEQPAMVNFRVDALDEVLARLAVAGAQIDPKQEDYGFGRFAWFWDPEGNRVELWEPEAPQVGESAG
jgi:predicted enzyme related to lactoylglutathione lyase